MASLDSLRGSSSWLGLGLFAAALAGACTLDTAGGLVPIGTDTTSVGGSGGAPTTGSFATVGTGGDDTVSSTSSSIGMSTTTTSTTGGMGGMGGMGGAGGSPPVIDWDFRRPITVTSDGFLAPSGYQVYVDVNHQALVAAGKSLASGADLRVAYDDGNTVVELPRAIDPVTTYNSAQTRLWFALQAPLPVAADDSDYYLYYGNPDASAVVEGYDQVFLFFDDFAGNTLDSAWTSGSVGNEVSNASVAPDGMGNLQLTGATGAIAGGSDDFVYAHQTISGDVAVRARVLSTGGDVSGFSFFGGLMLRDGLAEDARFQMASPCGGMYAPDNVVDAVRVSTGDEAVGAFNQLPAAQLPTVVEVARVGDQTYATVSGDGLSFSFIDPSGSTTIPGWPNSFEFGVVFSNQVAAVGNVRVDWLLVRSRVAASPDGSLTLPEEMGAFTF